MNKFQLQIKQISEYEKNLLEEYLQLVTYSELSEKEISRMDEILKLAESNLSLSLIMNEIDNWTYEKISTYQKEQKLIISPKTKKRWDRHSEDWGLSLGG